MTNEGHKPQEGRQSRERPAELFRVRNPEVEPVSAALRPSRQPHEGRNGEGRANARGRENPGGEKAQESHALGRKSKPLDQVADSRAEKNPEGGANAKRGKALGTAYGCVGGKSSEG